VAICTECNEFFEARTYNHSVCDKEECKKSARRKQNARYYARRKLGLNGTSIQKEEIQRTEAYKIRARRNKRYRDRKKERKIVHETRRLCKVCNKPFDIPKGKANQKTCCPECAEINRKKGVRESVKRTRIKDRNLMSAESKKKSEQIKKGQRARAKRLEKEECISEQCMYLGYPQNDANYCPFG